MGWERRLCKNHQTAAASIGNPSVRRILVASLAFTVQACATTCTNRPHSSQPSQPGQVFKFIAQLTVVDLNDVDHQVPNLLHYCPPAATRQRYRDCDRVTMTTEAPCRAIYRRTDCAHLWPAAINQTLINWERRWERQFAHKATRGTRTPQCGNLLAYISLAEPHVYPGWVRLEKEQRIEYDLPVGCAEPDFVWH